MCFSALLTAALIAEHLYKPQYTGLAERYKRIQEALEDANADKEEDDEPLLTVLEIRRKVRRWEAAQQQG